MKHCKESECKCENKFVHECDCEKCEDAERELWRNLGFGALREIWDNPKDEEAAKWYIEQFKNGAYDKLNKKKRQS